MEQGRIESMGSTLDFPHERFHSKYMQTNSWVALYEAKRSRRVTNPDKGNVLLKVTRPLGGQISRTASLISTPSLELMQVYNVHKNGSHWEPLINTYRAFLLLSTEG